MIIPLLYFIGAVASAFVALWMLRWTFYPDLRPGIFHRFDDWWTKETAGVDVKTLLWLGWAVIVWLIFSVRDALRDIHEELKSIRADLKRMNNSK